MQCDVSYMPYGNFVLEATCQKRNKIKQAIHSSLLPMKLNYFNNDILREIYKIIFKIQCSSEYKKNV